MEKTQQLEPIKPLLALEDYGVPSDLRARLVAYYDTLSEAKELAAALSQAVHGSKRLKHAVIGQELVAKYFDSEHFCHAMGWLALERDYLTMQVLYQAFPVEKPFYAHAEWVVPMEDDRRWELPFGNQYFLAHYNELYTYPNGEPPGELTKTGLCAQILALMSYRGWQSILPTSNQMIMHFNKLLWLTRDFDFLSKISPEPREEFERFYAEVAKNQADIIKQSYTESDKTQNSSTVAQAKEAAPKKGKTKKQNQGTGGKK